MGFTVKQLIKELQRMPQNAPVVWQDHEQADDEDNEINSAVGTCTEAEHIHVNGKKAVILRW
ncbi:hypothetical protein [Candidatus Symbiopectobacterium sp. NZEC135]|uniref:hypothetical protein n=1 Tax=Candidatus Symbiopectobacterium sp. NZEC135 TaxID=2820471 RepID=UPI0022269B40|nr:hypothetical protein [Candidatus Symbiopectobacterium sp. NZEC135]MCW2477701.1 hypothetical protein [Candidatus Symbiopectobacterium sp. NZEC135]